MSGSGLRAGRVKFTLVEMLVVIAIIGILASLLMPSLRKALAASRQAVCSNNLRQCGMGVLAYSSDFSGWLLWHDQNTAAGVVPLRDSRYWSIALLRHGYLPRDPVVAWSYESGVKSHYCYNVRYNSAKVITVCPSADFSRVVSGGFNLWSDVWDYGIRSAWYSEDKYVTAQKSIRITGINNKIPYLGDTILTTVSPPKTSMQMRSDTPHRRHNDQAQTWFVSGVVRGMSEMDLLMLESADAGASWLSHPGE